MDTRDKQLFTRQLAEENRAFYSTDDGRGALRSIDLSFEHRWTYVFELAQNAIDAGAKSLRFSIGDAGDSMVVEHDGSAVIREQDVRGLSKIFRSTKGVASVGFMGIGFKSVFGRFRRVGVSGWGWRFRYEIAETIGEEYGDRQPDLLGAVTPQWDESIAEPSPGFTTRFELGTKSDASADLLVDLAHLVPEADPTPLAIFAWAGLARIALPAGDWALSKAPDCRAWRVTAESSGARLQWLLLPVSYQPRREAVARFLEHRKVQPVAAEREKTYQAAAKTRIVLGVVPLDESARPDPPDGGRVYATLPTDVTLPFGIHVHADWLLNLSRTGLREIEENAWQSEIVDRIADVLVTYLDWVSEHISGLSDLRRSFEALRPVGEARAGTLDAMLVHEAWRQRLRGLLAGRRVLPAWIAGRDSIGFAAANEACLPPEPFADLFAAEVSIQPAELISRPVVARDLVGEDGAAFLIESGVLHEMTAAELEDAWKNGLASWWKALPSEGQARRDLLFRVWAAVAELQESGAWEGASLRCIRTRAGAWRPADEATYLSEPPPTNREPGGSEVARLIEDALRDEADRIPDPWIGVLRSAAGKDKDSSEARAWQWLEERAQKIDLGVLLKEAIERIPDDAETDVVAVGHWARNRQRSDLVSRVVAASGETDRIVPTSEALLAEPYVEPGDARRVLFAEAPIVSRAYLDRDPRAGSASEWRTFFEKAGALGRVSIQEDRGHASKSSKSEVALHLGIDAVEIEDANAAGYTLADFDIQPALPSPGSAERLRRAVAPWLEDGHKSLRDRGRRLAKWKYYGSEREERGLPARWRLHLQALEWVPCEDEVLRRPAAVLLEPDPARPDAPVAKVSQALAKTLLAEGLEFGADVAEAPAIRRLDAIGSTLDGASLARLLRECVDAAQDEEERSRLRRVIERLLIPTTSGSRVPLERLVLRTGSNHRSSLGGWIADLASLDSDLREQLESLNLGFPQTTTGPQALAYLKNVWERAGRGELALADQVRQSLPLAYDYCLEDCEGDPKVAEEWSDFAATALVFAGREWRPVADENAPFFDDVEDRRLLPKDLDLVTATPGHLGRDAAAQRKTAQALGLRMLSSCVETVWTVGRDIGEPAWARNFAIVLAALRAATGRHGPDDEDEGRDDDRELRLRCVDALSLTIRAQDREESVLVNARLQGSDLIVCGDPGEFAGDAAGELVSMFTLSQQGQLIAPLTQAIANLADQEKFRKSLHKFVRSHAPGFEVLADSGSDSAPSTGKAGGAGSMRDPETPRRPKERVPATPSIPRCEPSGRGSGSFTEDRKRQQLKVAERKLHEALYGELGTSAAEEGARDGDGLAADNDGGLGDEVYRLAVLEYERRKGRQPTEGHALQEGWDISSIDPSAGERRLIEVKGRGHEWTEDQIVELNRAKLRSAIAAKTEDNTTWWLYVVERTEAGYRVLPVPNPFEAAAAWILRGAGWRTIAEDPDVVEPSRA